MYDQRHETKRNLGAHQGHQHDILAKNAFDQHYGNCSITGLLWKTSVITDSFRINKTSKLKLKQPENTESAIKLAGIVFLPEVKALLFMAQRQTKDVGT